MKGRRGPDRVALCFVAAVLAGCGSSSGSAPDGANSLIREGGLPDTIGGESKDAGDASDSGEVSDSRDAGDTGEVSDSRDAGDSGDGEAPDLADSGSDQASSDGATDAEAGTRRTYALEEAWSATVPSAFAGHIAFSPAVGVAVGIGFTDTITLASSDTQATATAQSNDTDNGDVLVAALADADGRASISAQLGDQPPQDAFQAVSAVAVDAQGRTIVAGYFFDTLRVGGADLSPGPGLQGYVLAIDQQGAVAWSHLFPLGLSSTGVQALAADPASGRVFVGGSFNAAADLGCGAQGQPNGRDGFVEAFDAQGNCVAHLLVDGPGDQAVSDLEVDGAGGVALAGAFQHGLPAALDPSGTTIDPGNVNYFVCRLDSSGHPACPPPLTGSSQIGPPAIAVDGAGRIAFGAPLAGMLTVGPLAIDGDSTGFDTMVALFAADGRPLWLRGMASGAAVLATVAFASTGDVVLGSPFSQSVTLDDFALQSANDSQDLLLAVLDQADGRFLFARGAQATTFAGPLRLVSGAGPDLYLLSFINGPGSLGFGASPVSDPSDSTWNIISKLRLTTTTP